MAGAVDIAALIPHSGAMVLLESVSAWDATSIRCVTGTHANVANPLRRSGSLPAVCGVEYAGQAMALHGALLSGAKSRPGLLVSVRDVALHVHRLDDIETMLLIEAQLLANQPNGSSYRFLVRDASRSLVEGRAAVALL